MNETEIDTLRNIVSKFSRFKKYKNPKSSTKYSTANRNKLIEEYPKLHQQLLDEFGHIPLIRLLQLTQIGHGKIIHAILVHNIFKKAKNRRYYNMFSNNEIASMCKYSDFEIDKIFCDEYTYLFIPHKFNTFDRYIGFSTDHSNYTKNLTLDQSRQVRDKFGGVVSIEHVGMKRSVFTKEDFLQYIESNKQLSVHVINLIPLKYIDENMAKIMYKNIKKHQHRMDSMNRKTLAKINSILPDVNMPVSVEIKVKKPKPVPELTLDSLYAGTMPLTRQLKQASPEYLEKLIEMHPLFMMETRTRIEYLTRDDIDRIFTKALNEKHKLNVCMVPEHLITDAVIEYKYSTCLHPMASKFINNASHDWINRHISHRRVRISVQRYHTDDDFRDTLGIWPLSENIASKNGNVNFGKTHKSARM